MYYKRKSTIMFRNYKDFGYITDNRNFGYIRLDDGEKVIGDKILSKSGAVFFSVLTKKPQTLDMLVKKINKVFTSIDFEVLKNDAKDFYDGLEKNGFIVSGDTKENCNENDKCLLCKDFLNKSTNIKNPNNSLEKSTDEFFNEYFQGRPQLTSLHIEITSTCNERCIHCYIPHENKVNTISSALFYKILKQCNRLHLLHITISGGEPMLHRDFCNFLRKCRQYDFSVTILTNLTMLDNNIVKEMKKNPLLGVQVSLYSMNPIIHDGITKLKGSFEKTKNNILCLIRNNIPVQISCPIMVDNRNSYKEIIAWANKNNIMVNYDTSIIAKYNHSSDNLICRLTLPEIRVILKEKIYSDKKYLEKVKNDAKNKMNTKPTDRVCNVCQTSLCISETGNVYPCAGWQDYILGNVNDDSIKNIWNDSEKIQYLRSLTKKDFPKCMKCADKEFCNMCMVRNANEDTKGNPLAINNHFCTIARLTKEIILEN